MELTSNLDLTMLWLHKPRKFIFYFIELICITGFIFMSLHPLEFATLVVQAFIQLFKYLFPVPHAFYILKVSKSVREALCIRYVREKLAGMCND